MSDRLRPAGPHARLYVCSGALFICALAGALFPLFDTPELSAVAWGVVMMTACIPIGVAGANLQEMTPERMRGVVSAIYFFVVSLIGIATGPTIIAIISDVIFGGDTGIRFSLSVVSGAASVMAAVGFYLAARAQKKCRC